jgi:hypothetical protein
MQASLDITWFDEQWPKAPQTNDVVNRSHSCRVRHHGRGIYTIPRPAGLVFFCDREWVIRKIDPRTGSKDYAAGV